MKPVIADKLMVLLLLFSSVLGNLDGEGHQIEDCETGIEVCPWSATFSTRTPKRNNKNT